MCGKINLFNFVEKMEIYVAIRDKGKREKA